MWLELLLAQVEREAGLPPGRTGIEAQIEDTSGPCPRERHRRGVAAP